MASAMEARAELLNAKAGLARFGEKLFASAEEIPADDHQELTLALWQAQSAFQVMFEEYTRLWPGAPAGG